MRHRTQVIASYFNTPGSTDRRLFHAVLRAGHLKAAPDYRIERQSYPGHDLLLCLSGAGHVRVARREFAVAVNQLAWVDCSRPHAHWADPSHPWEVLWMRVEGTQMTRLAETLAVRRNPVFSPTDRHEMPQLFKRICALMREESLTMNAALHAAVATVIAGLFDSRQRSLARDKNEPDTDPSLCKVLDMMRLEHARAWNIDELAHLSGLSIPHFFRRFRKATGASPIDWLRRERVNQAKRRLSETRDRVRDIALRVGYEDPFYFSRDFKKLVGVSPRRYREQEHSMGALDVDE